MTKKTEYPFTLQIAHTNTGATGAAEKKYRVVEFKNEDGSPVTVGQGKTLNLRYDPKIDAMVAIPKRKKRRNYKICKK